MTLIELLVVVSILLMLALIAIPAVRPGIEGQRTREAARMVNVFISNARNRAEASGRPYGVEIERLTGLPLASAVLHQVEVPPPYAGDTTSAVVKVVTPPGGPGTTLWLRIQPGTWSSGLVRPGDRIQLNYQGRIYTLIFDPSDPSAIPVDANGFFDFNNVSPGADNFSVQYLTAVADPSQGGPAAPFPASGPPVAFSVFRQPVRTSATPLQLPRGTVIDLTWSGFATPTSRFLPAAPADASPVRIMFSPNGALWRVWATGFPGVPPTEPVFLLVGRRTRVPTNLTLSGGVLQIDGVLAANWIGPSPAEDGFTNLADLGNFWITIQAQTGLATTADVAAGAPGDIVAAREEAAKGRPVGGR